MGLRESSAYFRHFTFFPSPKFLCPIWKPVSSLRSTSGRRRAQELSRLAVAPTLPCAAIVARPCLESSEHAGSMMMVGITFEGSPRVAHECSCGVLVFGGPKTRTMMQSCASAAKLRGGGPILFHGIRAMGDQRDTATSNRHRRPVATMQTGPKLSGVRSATSLHLAGCRTTPSGTTPSRTKCHKAIRSLRARATIMAWRLVQYWAPAPDAPGEHPRSAVCGR